jgi:hypothetical protein
MFPQITFLGTTHIANQKLPGRSWSALDKAVLHEGGKQHPERFDFQKIVVYVCVCSGGML